MEFTYRSLVHRILEKWERKKKDTLSQYDTKSTPLGRQTDPRIESTSTPTAPRVLIALSGPPGSGKTTIANRVVAELNSLLSPLQVCAVAISADGFHLPRAVLAAMPDAEEANRRRGAPYTFDGAGVVALAKAIRAEAGRGAVSAPTFDHATKDPVPGGQVIGPEVEVCILEGNYLLCSEAPWGAIAEVVDDRWLVRVDVELARTRVAARHLQAGIETTMEAAVKRADENDLVNGKWVMEKSQGRYDVLIDSVEEPAL